jgi:hypothetical protein
MFQVQVVRVLQVQVVQVQAVQVEKEMEEPVEAGVEAQAWRVGLAFQASQGVVVHKPIRLAVLLL